MRYGLILPADGQLAAWQQSCLTQLEAAGHGRPQWAIRNRAEPRHGMLWRAFLRANERPAKEQLSPEEKDRSSNLDFALNFSGAPVEERNPAPAYGVWNCSFTAWAPGLWQAFLDGKESFPIALYAATASGKMEVLQKGAVPLAGTWPDVCRTVQQVLAGWPARHVREIATMGDRAELAPHDIAEPPGAIGFLLQGLFYPIAKIRRRWRRLIRFDIWNVGIAKLVAAPQRVSDLAHLQSIRWLPPRRELYYFADPFPFRHDGRDSLLVEAYGHPRGVKGEIWQVTLADGGGGKDITVKPAIVRPEHLSYPCLFQDGPTLYCAPEMHRESGCVLYRLESDGSWQPAHHILPGKKLVDPTIFRHQDRWWLFCTDAETGSNMVLLAFHAPEPAGPWTAHALNPLKCDAGTARLAGEVFRLGGTLYRPAQDCRQTYGGAVTVMEITALSPDSFREQAALRLEADPGWPYPDGLHHLVLRGDTVFFDAKRQKRSFLLWLKSQIPGN